MRKAHWQVANILINPMNSTQEMKRIPEAKIGALQLSSNTQKATLHCFATQDCSMTIDILDQQGRLFIQKKTNIQKGASTYDLSTESLKPGTYNAWVTMGGLTAIRPLIIPDPPKKGITKWTSKLF
jgi:hypothetical protein